MNYFISFLTLNQIHHHGFLFNFNKKNFINLNLFFLKYFKNNLGLFSTNLLVNFKLFKGDISNQLFKTIEINSFIPNIYLHNNLKDSLILLSNSNFYNYTFCSFHSILSINNSFLNTSIEYCTFWNLNTNLCENLLYIYRTYSFKCKFLCSSNCSASWCFLGVWSHHTFISEASQNYTLEFNNGKIIPSIFSSWIGSQLKLTFFYNNVSFTKAYPYRAGFCFTNCPSTNIAGFSIAENNNGNSFLSFYIDGSSPTLDYLNFINNSIISGGGWFEFASTTGFPILNYCLFIGNPNNVNWLARTVTISTINLINC